jgi:hypothetical protein
MPVHCVWNHRGPCCLHYCLAFGFGFRLRPRLLICSPFPLNTLSVLNYRQHSNPISSSKPNSAPLHDGFGPPSQGHRPWLVFCLTAACIIFELISPHPISRYAYRRVPLAILASEFKHHTPSFTTLRQTRPVHHPRKGHLQRLAIKAPPTFL